MESLALTLFMCYVTEENGSLKFENFICLYAALTCPDEEETFNLVFRVYANFPPDYDEEKKEYYVEAGRF